MALIGHLPHLMTFCCLLRVGHLQTDEVASAQSQLKDLTETFWEWKLRQFPESATREEFHDHDDEVESYTMETFTYRKNNCTLFLKLAEAINDSELPIDDKLTLDVIKDQLKTYINGYEWRLYGSLTPLNFLEGLHKDVDYWIKSGQYQTEEDFDKYLLRLERLPRQIKEVIVLMQQAIDLKRTNHRVSIEDVPNYIDEHFVNKEPRSTVFFNPFKERLGKAINHRRTRHHFQVRAEHIIRDSVQQSFRNLSTFIKTQYLPNTRQEYGVSSFEKGLDFYRSALSWHLSIDIEPSEVHQLGLREVERIKGLIKKIMAMQNFTGTLPEFFEFMRTKSAFYNHTQDEMLERYKKLLHGKIAQILPAFFTNLTEIPLVKVEQMPHDGIDAHYYNGTFVVNTRLPHTRASFVMTALALHEGNPGHHLQVSLMRVLPIPKFRRYLWGGKKYSAPFHFPYYTAFVEGWGLYSEFLGEEMELYADMYELFGRYTYDIFRACRLVVDTGIHAFGWSRDQAVEYMLNHTFTTRKQATTEVDRYITWPGQACAYKIGELRIKKLRKKAEDALGELFDIRLFHWEVMRLGFVPLQILDDSIDRWIQNMLSNTSGTVSINQSGLALLILIFSVIFSLKVASSYELRN